MKYVDCPLAETAVKFPNTHVWNDSCAIDDLEYAIARGAVGATTNPVIVGQVLKLEMAQWKDRIYEIINEMPTATEEEITWKLIEEMAIRAAGKLRHIYDEEPGGFKGRISIQTNAKYYRSVDRMVEQALHFRTLYPNLHVKMPATEAGIKAYEEYTYNGGSINATVSFTVPQAVAVGEAVERAFKRREAEGKSNDDISPVCTIMVGRTDDWLKVIAAKQNMAFEPGYLDWAGVAVVKRAYEIYKERGYKTRLLVAAFRNTLHWSEFVGGDVVLTIPRGYQEMINNSGISVEKRIDKPVDPKIIKFLLEKFPDFKRAYEPYGMTHAEFDGYGATRRTLRSFISAYDDLLAVIRNFMSPDPDKE